MRLTSLRALASVQAANRNASDVFAPVSCSDTLGRMLPRTLTGIEVHRQLASLQGSTVLSKYLPFGGTEGTQLLEDRGQSGPETP